MSEEVKEKATGKSAHRKKKGKKVKEKLSLTCKQHGVAASVGTTKENSFLVIQRVEEGFRRFSSGLFLTHKLKYFIRRCVIGFFYIYFIFCSISLVDFVGRAAPLLWSLCVCF